MTQRPKSIGFLLLGLFSVEKIEAALQTIVSAKKIGINGSIFYAAEIDIS